MTIEVAGYNSQWVEIFEKEASFIKNILKEKLIDIHHIGSTAVFGLVAKPSVDILCVVNKLSASLKLNEVGFQFRGEMNVPLRYYFRKGKLINLHVTEANNGFIKLNLCFRNYLRANQNAALQYANLKMELLKNPNSHIKTEGRFSGYTLGKNQFIKSILQKANFNDFCVNFCMHDDEWTEYHRIRKEQIFKPAGVIYDEKHLSLKDDNNHYFILYQGVEIVSVAHIELIDYKAPTLRSIATDEKHKTKGYAQYMLNILEQWVKLQKKVIKTNCEIELTRDQKENLRK